MINEFSDSGRSIDTVADTLDLFRLGYKAKQIAQQRGLTVDTVYNHLARALEQGSVALAEVVELSESEIRILQDGLLSLPDEQRNALKPVFEMFGGQYSYAVLRCVRAALQHQTC